MKRLLCRLLGHVRRQEPGARHPMRYHGIRIRFDLAQQYFPFSRSWLCWRCHDWIWNGPPEHSVTARITIGRQHVIFTSTATLSSLRPR